MSLYQINGVYYLYFVKGGKRKRFSLRTRDEEVATRLANEIVAKLDGSEEKKAFAAPRPLISKLYHAAKYRSKLRGAPCHLTKDELVEIFERSQGKCELTGITFSLEWAGEHTKRPFVPTIDRIDNAKPYSKENCRLVCYAINVAINEWGESVFDAIARGYLIRKNRTRISEVNLEVRPPKPSLLQPKTGKYATLLEPNKPFSLCHHITGQPAPKG